jgi:hypothetical protein
MLKNNRESGSHPTLLDNAKKYVCDKYLINTMEMCLSELKILYLEYLSE